MEKTNLSKRVVAGTLALLTVFGSAPASLQGVFAPEALIANAAESDTTPYKLTVKGNDAINFVTNVKVGTTSFDNAGLKKVGGAISVAKGEKIEVKSTVPLVFNTSVETATGDMGYKYTGSASQAPFGSPISQTTYTNLTGDVQKMLSRLNSFGEQDGETQDRHMLAATPTLSEKYLKYANITSATNDGTTTYTLKYKTRIPVTAVQGQSEDDAKEVFFGVDNADSDKYNLDKHESDPVEYYKVNTRFATYIEDQGRIYEVGDVITTTEYEALKATLSTTPACLYPTYTSDVVPTGVNSENTPFNADAFKQLFDGSASNEGYTINKYWLFELEGGATQSLAPYLVDNEYNALHNGAEKYLYEGDATRYVKSSAETVTLASGESKFTNILNQVNVKDTFVTKSSVDTLKTTVEQYNNTLTNDYAIANNVVDAASFTKTGSKGNYTYTFDAPANTTDAGFSMDIEVTTEKQAAKWMFDETPLVSGGEDNKAPAGLTISDGTTSGSTNATPTSTAAGGAAVNYTKFSTVTVTAKDPFQLKIDDKNKDNNFTIPTTTFDATLDGGKGMFKATFEMPESGDVPTGGADKAPVAITVKRLSENYTYTAKDNKLLASTDQGSVSNAEAATISAYYWKSVDKATYDAAADGNKKQDASKYYVKEKADGATLESGTEVFFDATASTELLAYNEGTGRFDNFEVAVYKNGSNNKETTPAPAATLEAVKAKTFKVTGTGKYVVKFVVNGKGDANKNLTISTSFEIKAPDKLTAENVVLDIEFKKGNTKITNQIVSNPTNLRGSSKAIAEFAMVKEGVKNLDGGTFTVTPKIVKADSNEEITYTNLAGKVNTKVNATYTGTLSGATIDKPYTIEVNVDDELYGSYKFSVQWQVSSYESGIVWTSKDINSRTVDIAQEDLADLEKRVYDSATDGVDNDSKAPADKVTYQYVAGKSGATLDEDELDERKDNLPKENGEYTVYVIYNGAPKAMVYVTIGNTTAVDIEYNEDDLKLTYGDTLDLTKFKLTEKKTGKEADNTNVLLAVQSCKPAVLNDDGTLKKDADGKYVTEASGDVANAYNTGNTKNVNAKTYIVTFSAKENVTEKKYSLSESKQYVLTVAKKEITADMISFLPVSIDGVDAKKGYNIVDESKQYTATTSTVNMPQFFDKATGITGTNYVEVKEGTTEKTVGDYTCTVKATDSNTDKGFVNNYTGSVDVKWHIVNSQSDKKYGGVDWVADKTTIYDNGRMHFEVKRNADDKITDAQGNKLTVKEFGVIIDKTGKFDAMADQTAQTAEAKAALAKELAQQYLVYGNGYATGSYTVGDKRGELYDASKQQVFKVNIKAQDTKTNIYARPFIVLTDSNGKDTVYYGTTEAYNLTDVAQEVFNLTCADGGKGYSMYQTVKREKDLVRTAADYETNAETGLPSVRNGYDPRVNKFYAYAQFTDLNKLQNGKEFQVSNFGVMIDKTGALDEELKADKSLYTTYTSNYDGHSYSYTEFDHEKAQAKVAEMLVVGSKYQQGKYNPNNKVLKNYQFAANITPKDSVTGFWVRAYLDLGNDLIIYTEPRYYASASEYYAETLGIKPEVGLERVSTGSDYKIKATVTYAKTPTIDSGKTKATFKRKGIVLDKKGIYNDETKYNLISGSADGVQTGSGTANFETETDTNKNYVAKFTPVDSIKSYVRPYFVYDVDGTEVTVYGDVYAVLLKNGNISYEYPYF